MPPPADRKTHVLHVFATFVPAGPQLRTVELLAHLSGGYRHSILAMDDRVAAHELIPGDVEVEVLPAPPMAGTLRTVPRLARLLKRAAPDLLCTYNWGALDAVLAARLRGFGHVVHHEDGFRPDEAHARKPHRNLARRLALSGVHTVVVISNALERIARDEWHVPERRLRFVPNGIEVDRFDPTPPDVAHAAARLRAELGLERAFVVGAVGHLRAEKNVERLLHVLAALPAELEARAVVLGEGPERERLEAVAAELGVAPRVHLVGHHADLRAWYRTFDAFAITSDTEQAPIALLEAMASGVPVVSTDVGDVRAMIPGEARAGVVSASTEERLRTALAARLEELARDPALRRRRADAGRARVRERYTAAAMIATYDRLWTAAAAAPGSPP